MPDPTVMPDMKDVQPRRSDVYFGTLVNRLLAHITRMQKKPRGPKYKMSWANLARATGINYNTLKRYAMVRDIPMSIEVLDRLMYATGLGVLDLLTWPEIIRYLSVTTYDERNDFVDALKKTVDMARKTGYDSVSGESISQ